MKSIVGASIVSIITESLYDKPIVVFREYTQNAVDSISQVSSSVSPDSLEVQIWYDENNLYFIDNGKGIAEQEFLTKMRGINNTEKSKIERFYGDVGAKLTDGINIIEKMPAEEKVKYQDVSKISKILLANYPMFLKLKQLINK